MYHLNENECNDEQLTAVNIGGKETRNAISFDSHKLAASIKSIKWFECQKYKNLIEKKMNSKFDDSSKYSIKVSIIMIWVGLFSSMFDENNTI